MWPEAALTAAQRQGREWRQSGHRATAQSDNIIRSAGPVDGPSHLTTAEMLAPRTILCGGVAVVMARKQTALALKTALTAALQSASPDDRAFLERWIAQANDPVFEKLGVKALARGEFDGELELFYRVVIAQARKARWTAQDVKSGVDLTEQREQKERDELLKLADKADDLAKFCRGTGRADLASLMSPQVRLGGLLKQHGMMPLEQLAELHEREAKILRQFVLQNPPRIPTRISRERRVREHVAFMYQMVQAMRELSGDPHYDAVADLTNIAYPNAKVTAENVRSACRPTKRSVRYKTSGALPD